MPVLILSEDDVRAVLTMDLALPAVEASFRKIALDEAVNVPRQRCQTDSAMLHVLPAAAKTLGALGFKAYTTGHFYPQFKVYLFDPKAGGLTAILDADFLGQVRTGAASAIAAKKLARADATTVGLLGTGRQARTQLEAVCKVRAISRAKVYSRDEAKRTAFATEMSGLCGVEVEPVATAREAVDGARHRHRGDQFARAGVEGRVVGARRTRHPDGVELPDQRGSRCRGFPPGETGHGR